MPRVKRGVTVGRRHKKVLSRAKGYYNARRKNIRTAKQAVMKSGQYAYRDRRVRKRDFRSLWIARINAGARAAANGARDLAGVEDVRVRYLGKKGLLTDQLKHVGSLPAAERPLFGKWVNDAKNRLGES